MPELPFKILGIEHIGIAVNDLNSISDVFGDLLGLELRSREKIDDQQVITDIYNTGSGKLEFLKLLIKIHLYPGLLKKKERECTILP